MGNNDIVAQTATGDDAYLSNLGDLWGRGWSVFPVRYRDKRPAIRSWTPYQKRAPTFDEMQSWFDRPERFNVGIVTGKVSGIFVIDLDSPEAIAWAADHLPPCAMRVRTAKGLHLYFPYSGGCGIRNKVRTTFEGKALELDVRGEGGYVLGPGSVHPSGHVYAREGKGWRA